ncbi:MAG TPA: putative LPS assembly protein LptD [Bacteroidia bacterium]|jgi:hypothetical protein|nr:putative LPS assembly protein LptD [Bacteroidia bacterium]
MNNQKVYLFGNAVVEYENTVMKAAYLEVNFKTHVVLAEGRLDTAQKMIGKPVVKEGEKTFTARKMLYNYETKKGKIYEITTQEGDGKVLGEAVKKDSTNVYYIEDGRYSTCNLDEPHFAIHAHKLKVIANDKIVTGPANLQVMGINTPLAVPFGLFPNKRGRASGIIIPTYGESTNQGFFLRGGGYYFGISDFVDLALKGDIYSHGSWGLQAHSNYKVRYQYSGSLDLNFARTLIENTTSYNTSQDNFRIAWSHVQDPKLNPSSRFSASVNAATSNFNTYNSIRPSDYLGNTLQSNISWQKSFVGTPFNLSTNLRHSQNTLNKTVDLSLPDVTLSMNRISPFKRADAVGETWYDKIGVSALVEGKNQVHTGDSILFKDKTIKKFQSGVHANVPVSMSLRTHLKTKSRVLNSLNFFSMTPSLTLNDNVFFSTSRERYYPHSIKTGRDTVIIDTVPIIRNAFDYSLSVSMATKIYGTYSYRHFFVKQIHHVITPIIAFVYHPDYSDARYGYYKTVQNSFSGTYQTYSVFQNGLFAPPPSGLQEGINMSLNNNLEAKLRPHSDTATVPAKPVSIFDNFSISSAYNAAAPHFKWSPISISAQTAILKKKVTINAGTTLDPYMIGDDGNDIEKFEINHNNRIGHIANANLSIGTSIRSKDKNAGKPKQSSKGSPEELEHINLNPDAYVDFNLKWTLGVRYILSMNKSIVPNPYVMNDVTGLPNPVSVTNAVTQTFGFNGDVNLTQKWKVGFNSGYDVNKHNFSYTSINVYRDLHCWDMAFFWVPFGPRQSYSLDIKVKSAVLQDLKLSRKREWYDYNTN